MRLSRKGIASWGITLILFVLVLVGCWFIYDWTLTPGVDVEVVETRGDGATVEVTSEGEEPVYIRVRGRPKWWQVW